MNDRGCVLWPMTPLTPAGAAAVCCLLAGCCKRLSAYIPYQRHQRLQQCAPGRVMFGCWTTTKACASYSIRVTAGSTGPQQLLWLLLMQHHWTYLAMHCKHFEG